MSTAVPDIHPTEGSGFSPHPATDVVAFLRAVTKRYGNGVVALEDLSLTLKRGEIVALLGPNGAGKSSAVKLLLGLTRANAGEVKVFGTDPRSTAARVRTGAMLQIGRAPEMLRVREHIQMFRTYYPKPLPYAEIVRAAGLEGIEERMFAHLSGGQKQRMLFGLALAGDPDLIFLDEPTVGLDIEARRGLWAEIRSLAARGKTVLLTTHYLEEADALAHRIVVINKGRMVCEGTPAQIKSMGSGGSKTATTHATSLRTIRCVTALSPDQLRPLSGVVEVRELNGRTTVVTQEPEAALRTMLAADITLHSLEVLSPLLEDAFLALTTDEPAEL